jgi:uncharacterized OB-fold protein
MIMDEYRKPLPRPTQLSQPFWDAAKHGELVVQTCTSCGSAQHPPRPLCLQCWSDALEWKIASGQATVYSFTVAYRSTTRGFREETPYVVAIVELDEGARLTTNIVGCKPDEVSIGMRVEVTFSTATDAITLPKFAPASA